MRENWDVNKQKFVYSFISLSFFLVYLTDLEVKWRIIFIIAIYVFFFEV